MPENNNFNPVIQVLIPLLVMSKSEFTDDILKRILEIRQKPDDIKPELTSDLMADITKQATRSFMENMNKVSVNGISEVSDV